MPELRQNFVTKEWVIISTERAKRPSQYVESGNRLLISDHPPYEDGCPFCVGNEELDLEVARYPVYTPWQTRVVRNKFPALAGDGLPIHTIDGVQHSMAGVGYHEVLVDHPAHNTTIALMESPDVQLVFETMQRRGQAITNDPRIQHVLYFKNHGKRAGASLTHPHCQIIGMPVVPAVTRRRMLEVRRHFDENGEDAIGRMMQDELTRGERLVAVSEHFVAFILYAALSPFHMWIVPRQQRACFLQVPDYEITDLAYMVRQITRKIYFGLNDPDYNLIIRSAPVKEVNNPHLHWYITVVPRLSFAAGFEMGSGMHINPSLPEHSASFLRDIQV